MMRLAFYVPTAGSCSYSIITRDISMRPTGCRIGEAYRHLHRLAQQGRIAAATVDLVNDANRCTAIGKSLRVNGLVTDTCYWSNIASFLHPHNEHEEYVRTKGSVFASRAPDKGGLHYDNSNYHNLYDPVAAPVPGLKHWNGDEVTVKGRLLKERELPGFERLMRHVSAVAGKAGMHIVPCAGR